VSCFLSLLAMLWSQMAEAAAVQHAGELLHSVSAGYGAVKPRDEAAAVAVEEASGRECALGWISVIWNWQQTLRAQATAACQCCHASISNLQPALLAPDLMWLDGFGLSTSH